MWWSKFHLWKIRCIACYKWPSRPESESETGMPVKPGSFKKRSLNVAAHASQKTNTSEAFACAASKDHRVRMMGATMVIYCKRVRSNSLYLPDTIYDYIPWIWAFWTFVSQKRTQIQNNGHYLKLDLFGSGKIPNVRSDREHSHWQRSE
jgi:hypothetical protein